MAEQSLKIPEEGSNAKQSASTLASGGSQPELASNAITTKEMVISAGAVLVAAIVFFIIKNYVSKMLVSGYRKSPQSADMAGWGLFCLLLLVAIFSVLMVLDSSKFMAIPYLIIFGLGMVVSIVIFVMALGSKR